MDTLLTILGVILGIVVIGVLLVAAAYAALYLFAIALAIGVTLLWGVVRVISSALLIRKSVELTVRSEHSGAEEE